MFIMGLFDFWKKDLVVDLSEKYKKQQAQLEEARKENETSKNQGTGFVPFFNQENANRATNNGSVNNNLLPENNVIPQNPSESDLEERRRKLSQKLSEIIARLENLSTQLSDLQQRVEIIERRTQTG